MESEEAGREREWDRNPFWNALHYDPGIETGD